MARIENHDYLKVCAQIASYLSISIASARRKVDLVAAKAGKKDFASRKEIALSILEDVQLKHQQGEIVPDCLDKLLEALAEDENFMVED